VRSTTRQLVSESYTHSFRVFCPAVSPQQDNMSRGSHAGLPQPWREPPHFSRDTTPHSSTISHSCAETFPPPVPRCGPRPHRVPPPFFLYVSWPCCAPSFSTFQFLTQKLSVLLCGAQQGLNVSLFVASRGNRTLDILLPTSTFFHYAIFRGGRGGDGRTRHFSKTTRSAIMLPHRQLL
jgi:hypothetical protein